MRALLWVAWSVTVGMYATGFGACWYYGATSALALNGGGVVLALIGLWIFSAGLWRMWVGRPWKWR